MTPEPAGLQTASRTDRGVRDTNEDAVLCVPLHDGRWLAAVADGMGGLQEGEMASRTALDVLRRRIEAGTSLVGAVEEANRAVFERTGDGQSGTTLVAALVASERVRIANVGDSRAYLLGPAGLVQVTRDHTFGAEAAQHGEATAKEVALSRWGATLTRSLGAAETVEVDEFGPLALDDGVLVLLCSDGVHGVLGEREIERCLIEGRTLDDVVDHLLGLSLERGGRDNLSAVVVRGVAGSSSRSGRGTVRSGSGVSKAGRDDASTPPAIRIELPPEPEPEPVAQELVLGSAPGEAQPGTAEGRWDPARMASRSLRTRRRKPGRLRAVLLVLALLAVVAVMMTFLLP